MKKKRGPKTRAVSSDMHEEFVSIILKIARNITLKKPVPPGMIQFLRESRPYFEALYPDRPWPKRTSADSPEYAPPAGPANSSESGPAAEQAQQAEPPKPYIVEEIE